ncbi:MAG: LPD38 domain-containing protein [Pseudohongiellaceae bacterium]
MGNGLQNFREQYPQYNELDDEELAGKIYDRYYPDMDQATYRDSMGLAPLETPEPEEEPGIWDRVKSVFAEKEKKPAEVLADKEPDSQVFDDGYDQPEPPVTGHPLVRMGKGYHVDRPAEPEEEEPPPRARLRDQLFAGFDEMRANRATMEAFDAIEVARNAEMLAQGQAWPRPADYEGPVPLQIQAPPVDPREVQRIREEQIARLQGAINKRAELSSRAEQIPYYKETQDMLTADTFGEAVNEFTDDPIMIIAETSLRSLPNMAEALPMAVAGSLVAGPMGFAAGMGGGARMTEYRSAYAQYLQEHGVDLEDARALIEATEDDDLMREAHSFANTRANIIGTVSVIGAGVATQQLTPFVKGAVARELSNVAAQTTVQAGLEGTGEAVAQLATEGEVSPGDVMAEVTGSLAQAPIEVGAATVTGVRSNAAQQQILDIEAEVREMLGDDLPEQPVTVSSRDVPRETAAERLDAKDQGQRIGRRARQFQEQRMEGFDTDQVLYHGTGQDFETFEPGRAGLINFSESPEFASEFAPQPGGRVGQYFIKPGKVFDFVNNPEHRQMAIDLFNERGGWRDAVELNDAEIGDDRVGFEWDDDLDQGWELFDEPETDVLSDLREQGFDTFIYDDADGSITTAVANPDQIVNVTGQVGNLAQRVEADPAVLDSRIPDDRADPVEARQPGQTDVDVEVNRQSDRRARIERMSLDELVDRYYTDQLTGLGNRAAFDEEIQHSPFVASIDADSLKWINDNLGHDAGDALLQAVGESLRQEGVDAYRIGGDEFYIGGQTREEVEAAIALAEGVLANQTLSSPNGSKKGIQITSGIGTDKASSDSRMEVEKKRKKGRAGRGEMPEGVTLSQKAKPLDMNPGTNYVPIIGNTGQLPIDANYNLILQTTGKPVRIPKKAIRREHILHVMQKYFGNRIYQGRVKGKTRLGFYRPGHGEVRLKKYNDIEVAAHEIAHFLDDRYPWIEKLYKQHDAEVRSVSYDEKLIFEGYAEFMRLWMTQEPEAMQRTPSFYDAFNKEAKARDPQLWKMLLDLQELMHAWTQQGARKRAASKHSDQGESFIQKVRAQFTANIFQRALDGLRSIKTIAADLSDYDQLEVTDAYERLRLAVGGSNGVLEAAMFFGTPKWRDDGQGIELGGDSLQSIWGNDWGDNEVAMYMIARRAQELAEQGRENLMRADEIAAWLSLEKERPELADKFEKHQAFNEQLLDFAQGGGILGDSTRAAIEEMNKNYVPFHRVVESEINGTQVQAGGNPFQRLTGGTQNINNVWDNIVNNAGMVIRMSMINDGKRQLLRKLGGTDHLGSGKRNQQAGVYAAPIDKETKPVSVGSDQLLRKVVEAMGVSWKDYRLAKETGMYPAGEQGTWLEATVLMVDQMQNGLEDFVQFWKFNQDPKGDNVEMYMDAGEKHFFEINDPNLMDSLRFLGPRGTNLLLGILGAFSATLRRGVVAVPVFQIKNFIRDTTNAWLLSSNVKVPAARALRVVFSRMNKDPAYVEMLLNGGGFANRSQGLQAQRKVIVDPTRLAAFYDRFMGRFENANRLAEYKAAREAGESPRRAALLSREISTDFAMRGSSDIARYLAISVPFLNARAQGLYRVKRQFDLPETTISYATRGLALAAATMALYALNKDDERYKELPEDIKDLNWVFFTGDQEDDYILMPKPFESGMLFGTIPERMFEFAEQENGKEFADALGWMMLQTFHMDMTPQVFQPLVDLRTNKKFTGAPIIPNYLKNVEPGEQYTYYTSEAVREAAQAMGVSPIKMEHLLRGYLGTLGTYGIGAADAMIRAATDPEDRQFGEDPTRGETWKENILVKGLIDPLVNEGPPRRTKYKTDLYDMLRDAQLVANTVALKQKRTLEELEQYLGNPEKLAQFAVSPALVEVNKIMRELRQQSDRIRQSQDLTGDEKRVQLWQLTREQNKVARQAVLEIEQARMQAEEQAANAQ